MTSIASAAPPSLALLLPTAEECELLRACLWSGDDARAAWLRWLGTSAGHGGLPRGAAKALLPLLHRALRANDFAAPADLRTSLGAAAIADELRSATYWRVWARVFAALEGAAVPFVALKGAALAATVYPEPSLRHSHDIDLLVEPERLDAAAAALSPLILSPTSPLILSPTSPLILSPTSPLVLSPSKEESRLAPGRGIPAEPRRLVDSSGLPIELHTRLFRFAYHAPRLADVRARAVTREVDGHQVVTLAAADQLVHVCGQAVLSRSRETLAWACDAWFLIERSPDLDWDLVLRAAREARLELPLFVLFEWLRAQLRVPVSERVLEALAASCARADRAARQVALTAVRAGTRGRLRSLLAAERDWRGRLEVLAWMAVPSPVALRGGEPLRFPRLWPAYYAARPLGYLARRFIAVVRSAVARTDTRSKGCHE